METRLEYRMGMRLCSGITEIALVSTSGRVSPRRAAAGGLRTSPGGRSLWLSTSLEVKVHTERTQKQVRTACGQSAAWQVCTVQEWRSGIGSKLLALDCIAD